MYDDGSIPLLVVVNGSLFTLIFNQCSLPQFLRAKTFVWHQFNHENQRSIQFLNRYCLIFIKPIQSRQYSP